MLIILLQIFNKTQIIFPSPKLLTSLTEEIQHMTSSSVIKTNEDLNQHFRY